MFVFVFVSSMLTKLDKKTLLTFDNDGTSRPYTPLILVGRELKRGQFRQQQFWSSRSRRRRRRSRSRRRRRRRSRSTLGL